jgi:hypothetical protein
MEKVTAVQAAKVIDTNLYYIRSVAAKFLAEANIRNIESELTDLLVHIEARHQEEIKKLRFMVDNGLGDKDFERDL